MVGFEHNVRIGPKMNIPAIQDKKTRSHYLTFNLCGVHKYSNNFTWFFENIGSSSLKASYLTTQTHTHTRAFDEMVSKRFLYATCILLIKLNF